MALDIVDKLQPVRARAKIINRLFNNAQNIGLKNQGFFGSPTETSGAAIKNPKEYNAGYSYIAITTQPYSYGGDMTVGLRYGAEWSNQYSPHLYRQTSDISAASIENANNYSDIVGYLTPITVAEYMAKKSIRNITRIFADVTDNIGAVAGKCLVDKTTLAIKKENELFADYIVPLIDWFYTDKNGNRQKLEGLVFPYYFFAATSFIANELTQNNLFGGTYYDYVQKTIPIGGTGIGYFAFSPPYVSASTNLPSGYTSTGLMQSGVVYEKYPEATLERRLIYIEGSGAPYVLLYANAPDTTPLYDADVNYIIGIPGLNSTVNLGVSSSFYSGDGDSFAAYESTQSIIDLFEDYGIKVTTNLDEAMNPPETDDGVINPDNPAEPMPFFPDNSSDETPIEGAYITPSNFAQSCVYNPLTTRDFLRWICDNTVDVKNWSRLFANPVDVITGINLYNLNIPAHDSAHTALQSETNILGVTTNIPNYAILDGYNNIIDGGTLTLEAYYGNYADFTSMTYQCFIPFVGFTSLRACDVVNKTLHLYYAVDFATGAAVAFLNSDNKLIYTSPCTVAGKIPLSTSDKNSQMINNTLSILGSVGGLLGGIASGNVGGGVGALMGGLGGLQLQTNYANKGSLSAVNIYKLLPAFIERTRYDLFFPSDDQQYLGAKYQGAAGAPSTYFDTLVNCANAGGFVQSDVVYITSGTATETEKAEIAALIKSGVYL